MARFVATFCVIVVAVLTGAQGQDAYLQIQPNGKVLSKQIGSNLALTCTPIAPGDISQLEWRDPLGRKVEHMKGKDRFVQNLPGETGAVLIFNGLKEQHGGNYTCQAMYATSIPLSASVLVKPYDDIMFVDAPENQFSEVGKEFHVKCEVKGNPAPFIDWSKNDESITTNEKYIISDGELIIKNVTEADDGVYKCTAVVVSTGQIKPRNIKVEVQVPPKIIPMAPITVIEGEKASVQCVATGKPPPTYKWIKLRERKDLSKTDRFDVKALSGDFYINRVEFTDDGEYECVAENPVAIARATFRIDVLVKPKIYELLNVTVPVTNETELVCKAFGRPAPTIVFKKLSNQEPFRVGQQLDDRRIIMSQQFFEEKHESFAKLVISNVSRHDDGLYQCIAENSAGKADKNGHITVQFPPTFSRTKNLPPVWSWDGRPGNLSCLPEAIPNATIIWRYGNVDITEENFLDAKIFRNIFQVEGTSPQSFLIVNPHNDQRYFVPYECIARNALGEARIKIPLKQARIPGPIGEAKPIAITATTVKFLIVPPYNYDGPSLRSFIVRYKETRFLSWDNSLTHTWSYGAPYILEGLLPERTYDFQFAAENDVGLGPFTNAEQVTMPRRSAPAEPKILVPNLTGDTENDIVVSPYPNHFELRWNVPADNGDAIKYYIIKYCVSEMVDGKWIEKDCSEPIKPSVHYTNYQMDTLQPNTVYKIELQAHNAIGDSSPAFVRVRTATGLDPIIPVESTAMSSTVIVGIVVSAILIVLLVVDITCFCVNRTGVIALCCERSRARQKDEEDPKLGSGEMEPLKPEPDEKPMVLEYDGKTVYTKSGEIIGKHSAV